MKQHRHGRVIAGLAAAWIVSGAAATAAGPARRPPGSDRIPEARTQDAGNMGLAGYAKLLCSELFVTGAAEGAAREHGSRVAVDLLKLPAADVPALTDVIDRKRKLVRATLRGRTRTARRYGDQGCVVHPENHDGIYFEPAVVTTRVPKSRPQPWPIGDGAPEPPAGVDPDRLRAALEPAFAPPARTRALVVVHRGRLVAERYAPGITKDTLLEGWSMGKSLTATLAGRLLLDGAFRLDDPAPVPEWAQPDDPRRRIRVSDLLRMSSGLQFSNYEELRRAPDGTTRPISGYPDHTYVYTGAMDVFRYSATRPLEHAPNTVGRYRNCDPLLLGYLVKRAVTARGEEYLGYPQRALFDEIGIRRMVLDTDPHGNFILSGYDYGTARDWARIGLLYLREGVWEGKRLLPREFVEFVRTPAPAWYNEEGKRRQSRYGGLWWVNTDGRFAVPADAYFAAGAGGQTTLVVPSLDLVIARFTDYDPSLPQLSEKAFNAALPGIVAALPR